MRLRQLVRFFAVVALPAITALISPAIGIAQTDPRCSQSGSLVQFRRTELTDKMRIDGGIELDDSIPQSNEGTQLMQLAVTPRCINSRLLVEALVYVSEVGDHSDNFIVALFRDHGVNAIAAGAGNFYGSLPSQSITPVPLSVFVPSRSLNRTTFTLRAGAENDAIDVNAGVSRGVQQRGLGGRIRSYLQVTEIVP